MLNELMLAFQLKSSIPSISENSQPVREPSRQTTEIAILPNYALRTEDKLKARPYFREIGKANGDILGTRDNYRLNRSFGYSSRRYNREVLG